MADSERVAALLAALTLEEKCQLLAGKNMWETASIDRLGIRSLKTTDGPAGVRGATWTDGTHTTFIPCGISLAATFNPGLIRRVGGILGLEARSKHAHVLLAPTMNMSRSPLGGRNFENFGEDPYLSGIMAREYIRGVQEHGVGACMKHFVANDMETRRFNMDIQIDERTLREIYLKPFEMALEADPWTAMTAYPKINGQHADCSTFLLRQVLRGEWGFKNLVMCDWGGLNDTVESITAGTDLEMPGPAIRYGAALLNAVNRGDVSEKEHIDASVTRLLQLLDRFGLLSPAAETKEVEKNSDLPEFRQTAREAASESIVLLKNENHLLPLKLKSIKRLAIIGPNAKKPTTGGTGSAAVNPYYITTPFESISAAVKESNKDVDITFSTGIQSNLQPSLPGSMLRTPDGKATGVQVDFYAGHDFSGPVLGSSHWNNSVIFMMSDGDTPETLRGKPHCYRVRGVLTPTTTGTYELSLSSTGRAKLFVDGGLVIDNSQWTQTGGTFMNCGSVNRLAVLPLEAGRAYALQVDNVVCPPPIPPHDNTLFHTVSGLRVGTQLTIDEEALFAEAVAAAQDADAVVLVVGHNNDTEKEGIDRTSLALPRRTDELVAAVCAANRRAVVVTQSASAIAMPWADGAPAIVHAWYQGQENGNALADVLLGRASPSGKLPVTFPRSLEDHGSHAWFPGDVDRDYAEYGEGILVGYRWFDAKQIEPLWPFGYGLSYTQFSLDNTKVTGLLKADDPVTCVNISTTVSNQGSFDGAEVVQVYVSPSPVMDDKSLESAPKSLVGFSKVYVAAGGSKDVSISLSPMALAWYDVSMQNAIGATGSWRIDKGQYSCFVGTSSRDIRATLQITVE
ncbi:putative glycosyl hydrolase [Pestalotiopsis sp. NC0098]|nr:putative glycosyl hydrolase [Pestalotiopsis sp. NC0098]